MERLMQIASELAGIVTVEAYKLYMKEEQELDLKHFVTSITPEEGWPGSNDSKRDAARDKSLLASDSYLECENALMITKSELATLSGKKQALEAERRAIEWSIRAKAVGYVATTDYANATTPEDAALEAHIETAIDEVMEL